MNNTILIALLAAGVSAFGFNPFAPPRDPSVICPAVSEDNRDRNNSAFSLNKPVELVVIGKARVVDAEGRIYEIHPTQVLYGQHEGDVIRASEFRVDTNTPLIFALSYAVSGHDLKKAPYTRKYLLPVTEETSQRALAAARLDYNTLSAEHIFIGTELNTRTNDNYLVRIDRVLHGNGTATGDEVQVRFEGSNFIIDADRPPRTKPEIYFIEEITTNTVNQERTFLLNSRLHASKAANVLDALKRRDVYPMIVSKYRGKERTRLEVLFRGDISEAIDLLGSESRGAVKLGERRLLYENEAALDDIDAAIRADLYRVPTAGGNNFRRLRNLIGLLREMDTPAAQTIAEELAREYVEKLASAEEPTDFIPLRNSSYYEDEEDRVDVNHALAWLMMAMDRERVITEFGGALQEMKTCKSGYWQNEIQLALNAAKIEDSIELAAAILQARSLTPIRSAPPRLHHDCDQVAFSRDGHLLATAGYDDGVKIWNTADWTLKTTLVRGGHINQLIFGPEGKTLYIAGSEFAPLLARYDLATGDVLQPFAGHDAYVRDIWLSRDGRILASNEEAKTLVHIWNVETGQSLKTYDMLERGYKIAFNAKCDTVARTSPEGLVIESVFITNAPSHTIYLDDPLHSVAFSQDGQRLITLEIIRGDNQTTRTRIRTFDAMADYNPINIAEHDFPLSWGGTMSISPDGNILATGNTVGSLGFFSTDTLEQIAILDSPDAQRRGRVQSIDFAANTNIMAAGLTYGVKPHLIDTSSFKGIKLEAGHELIARRIFLSLDGTQVRSIGRDDTVCLWNAATMNLIRKTYLPEKMTCIDASPPDGRYLFLANKSDFGRPFLAPQKPPSPIKIFDTDTNRTIAELDLPVNWKFAVTKLKWLANRQAIVSAGEQWFHFNYVTGKFLNCRDIDINTENDLFNGGGHPTEDSKSLFIISGGGKDFSMEIRSFDIATHTSERIGEFKVSDSTGNERGLIPDGKHFFIGGPGLYIYDRNTLELVASKEFKDLRIDHLIFSPDGSRYAVVTEGYPRKDGKRNHPDVRSEPMVRVHETISGNMLIAIPLKAGDVEDMQFSPTGKRLVVALADGTIEIWPLSKF